MLSDWSVECGADDPVVVLPWQSEDGSLRYFDLRRAPEAIEQISEARQFPTLASTLRRWNHPDAPIFTAKCDVWSYPADLFDAGDLPGYAFAQGSYIDLIPSNPEMFRSFAACENQLRIWTAIAQAIPLQECRCEWTLRSALIFPSLVVGQGVSGQTGFATTLYAWGYGSSPQAAASAWSQAITALSDPVSLAHAH
jgi:hypothetical protein